MTIGTAIVISVAIICVTILAVIGIGAVLAVKKTNSTKKLTDEITSSITDRLTNRMNK